MNIEQKKQFIKNLISNESSIINEYMNFNRRTVPLTGWDDEKSIVPGWSGIALWWKFKEWPSSTRRCPITTELIRHGPDHRASGWLVLDPHSRTPEHDHKDWGHKIICHLPTQLPVGDSGFVVEGKTYHWKMGEFFAFDARKKHYGYNNTDEKRVIFVIDFDYDEWYDVLKEYMH